MFQVKILNVACLSVLLIYLRFLPHQTKDRLSSLTEMKEMMIIIVVEKESNKLGSCHRNISCCTAVYTEIPKNILKYLSEANEVG